MYCTPLSMRVDECVAWSQPETKMPQIKTTGKGITNQKSARFRVIDFFYEINHNQADFYDKLYHH